ncbi:glycosyltransferase family 2 protein [Sodalis ligni]|uniref:Glycosyltransferase involved in cell wall biosynthesis n=1 Tax=Sodalis ligni TaxID=2697027 RepID=A0A4R1NSD2_9GAMM|nr:glycosyltransferase family 2 protein [Sodalis ligni]TCL07370.1 glycosyltransferase involved in cell wall biosynthesis [Sodalis ligni]
MNKQSAVVAILLGSKNGAAYLQEQLNSFCNQTHHSWQLWVSDDGSSDSTIAQIKDFIGRTNIEGCLFNGPQTGLCDNFMSLISNTAISANYYAFADQDDIWLNDKLSRAVQWLNQIDQNIPALYCSRTRLIDSAGRTIGYSPLYKKEPSFGNALLQNIASGNTMVFNQRARELMLKIAPVKPVIHDWTLYQLVTGCGGKVKYDPEPTVLYRQHGENIIGNSMGLQRRMHNFLYAHGGRMAGWNDINCSVLSRLREHLTPAAKDSLASFCAIRDNKLSNRLKLMRQSGVYHQQFLGSITTLTYVLLNKF